MLGIIGIVLGTCVVALLIILINKLNKGLIQIQLLNQTISDKLKSKYEIINEMSVTEARIKYTRARAMIFELLEESAPIWTNIIAKALGGKGSSVGYREGG